MSDRYSIDITNGASSVDAMDSRVVAQPAEGFNQSVLVSGLRTYDVFSFNYLDVPSQSVLSHFLSP
jgi:hypothetical protein